MSTMRDYAPARRRAIQPVQIEREASWLSLCAISFIIGSMCGATVVMGAIASGWL